MKPIIYQLTRTGTMISSKITKFCTIHNETLIEIENEFLTTSPKIAILTD